MRRPSRRPPIGAAQTGEAARVQRAETLYRTLTAAALRSQAPLRAWLDERGVPYRAFYIVNMIEVQGDAELAQALRTAPGVERLAANPLVHGGTGGPPAVEERSLLRTSHRPTRGRLGCTACPSRTRPKCGPWATRARASSSPARTRACSGITRR